MLITCSRMLWIKNKTTQLLRTSSETLSPLKYNDLQTNVTKDMPSSFNAWMRTHKDNKYNPLAQSHLYVIMYT
jgi:hypothetical protein